MILEPEDKALKEIAEILIKPLLMIKPESQSAKDFLQDVFCIKERTIEAYFTLKPFKMPGEVKYPDDLIVTPGVNRLNVKCRQRILVRHDMETIDRVEVEVFGPPATGYPPIQMSRIQFESIAMYLRRLRKFNE